MSKKRILIIVENLSVPFDRRVWNESLALTNAGYSVSVICPKGWGYDEDFEVVQNVSIYRYPKPPEGPGVVDYLREYSISLFWQVVLTARVSFKEGVDIIQACNPPDNMFMIALPFKLLGKKFVFDQHDICPEVFLAKYRRRGFFYSLLLLFERLTFLTCNICMVTNESHREIAVHRGKMDSSKVFVVRNGPDLEKIQVHFPKENLKEGRKFLVSYVGVVAIQEGLRYLLKAIEIIVKKKGRTDVLFVLMGSGPDWENLVLEAREMGLEEHIRFTGRVGDETLYGYLSTSDVCVSPDEANEMNDNSTMIKIMEYMAFSKAIVQFDLREGRFSAQGASLYALRNDPADFAEKICELLDSPEKRRRMGALGRDRIEKELAWEYSERELLRAYDSLMDGDTPFP